jgi:pilus assembly protein FimV
MARTPANLITAAALLGLPTAGLALGLGDIQLKSALNQPLDAQIEILGATPQDLRDLKAAIAGRDAFNRYGIDYPQMVGSFRFSVEKGADGRDVLRVTSPQPITEPFLTFLIEADWARGKLMREYTVLLDPPVFMPEPSTAVAVQAPRGETAQPSPGAGTIERAAPVQSQPATEPASEPVHSTVAATSGAAELTGEYQVRRGDTLWMIASRTRPGSPASLNQMMVALYRANPDAFLGNMNLLKEGATLKVPADSDLAALSSTDADAEFERQATAWQGAEAPHPSAADARLKLVPPKPAENAAGETPSTTAAGAATGSAALAQAEERNSALTTQVSELQQQLDEARRLITVKDGELAKMQQELASAGGTQPAPAVTPPESGAAGVDVESGEPAASTSSTAAAPAPEAAAKEPAPAAKPAQKPTAAPTPAAESGGLFKSTWFLLTVGVALVLGALGVAAFRRRSALAPIEALEAEAPAPRPRVEPELEPAEVEATLPLPGTALPAKQRPAPVIAPTPVPQTSDTGNFEITGTFRPVDFESGTHAETDVYPFEDSGSALAIDQADPISEADFHLAYGLYDQAAELVKGALDREPRRPELQVKLIEILFMWGNKEAFRERAEAFRADLKAAGQWDKIAVMGKQICPGDALFETGAAPTDAGVDLELASSSEMPVPQFRRPPEDTHALDFDLDDALTAKASIHAAETVPATGEFPTLTEKKGEEVEVHDEQLTAVARRLEAKMRPRAGDVGVALDLGETIAPEEVSSTHTFGEVRAKGTDDDAFGDFFAFTGVAEAPEPDPTGTREVVLDFEGDLLPDSTTAEFKIELPDDGSSIDLDVGDGSQNADTQRSQTLGGATTTMLGPRGGETTVVSSFGDTETMKGPGFVDSTARTVQARSFGTDFDLIGGGDETVSASALDLDLGASGTPSGESDRGGTVRVSPAELALPEASDGVLDEVGTKLDLARAYIDMGDPDGARSILEEVIEEGDESQRQNAHTLLRSIA